jgi:hypothetical protein
MDPIRPGWLLFRRRGFRGPVSGNMTRLSNHNHKGWKVVGITSRIVDMKTELALERQKNVVVEAALSFFTARTMAGCWVGHEDGLEMNMMYEQKACS